MIKDINKLKKVVYSDDCVKYLEVIGYTKVTETTFLNDDKTKRADIVQIGTVREITFGYV